MAEKRRASKKEEDSGPRGMSRSAWFEDQKKKLSKELEANGLDITKAYLLESQEAAEAKYNKWEKKTAAFGWDGERQTGREGVVVQMDERGRGRGRGRERERENGRGMGWSPHHGGRE